MLIKVKLTKKCLFLAFYLAIDAFRAIIVQLSRLACINCNNLMTQKEMSWLGHQASIFQPKYYLCNMLLQLPAITPNGYLNAVVEIPAGTNTKYEIDKTTGEIRPDLRDGKPRRIDFLSYPLNYGFIPSTRMDPKRGGDGDPLDVLTLAESLPTGTVIEVIPIGLLLLKDLGEWDNKVLAIPADPALRIIRATNWTEFQMEYSAARHIIEQFFLHYDGPGVMTPCGWADEKAAMEEVRKWLL